MLLKSLDGTGVLTADAPAKQAQESTNLSKLGIADRRRLASIRSMGGLVNAARMLQESVEPGAAHLRHRLRPRTSDRLLSDVGAEGRPRADPRTYALQIGGRQAKVDPLGPALVIGEAGSRHGGSRAPGVGLALFYSDVGY
jgi:hypothetical protein